MASSIPEPASCQCGPWGLAVLTQEIEFLSSMWETSIAFPFLPLALAQPQSLQAFGEWPSRCVLSISLALCLLKNVVKLLYKYLCAGFCVNINIFKMLFPFYNNIHLYNYEILTHVLQSCNQYNIQDRTVSSLPQIPSCVLVSPSSYSQPLLITDLYSVPTVVHFLQCCINGVKYMCYVWGCLLLILLLPLNLIYLRFIHLVVGASKRE